MNDKKYYTPTIDDICVGLEYEAESIPGSNDWMKLVIPHQIKYYLMGIERFWHLPNTVRVKHLDREDIESLGWEYDEEAAGVSFYDNKNNKRFVLIFCEDLDRVEISDEESEFGFIGIIKNKSELKRLMKQLGI